MFETMGRYGPSVDSSNSHYLNEENWVFHFNFREFFTKSLSRNSKLISNGFYFHIPTIQIYINKPMYSYTTTCAVVVYVCSGSVVVTAYDFESGRLGSNPEWGLIYY